MKEDNRKVVITHLPLDKDREAVFSIVKRSRLLINSICEYSKDLKRKGVKIFERKANIIRTSGGYFCAFYEDDIKENRIEQSEEMVKQFEGIDGRMKVVLHNEEGEDVIKDVAEMTAILFVPNPEKYEFVKFKDGNPKNLEHSNLYWSKKK